MNDFLTIKSCSFYNHLMHEKLVFKPYEFLFINLLKHVYQDEWSGSSIFFLCVTYMHT